MNLYTCGYNACKVTDIVGLLYEQAVKVVIDTRSHPSGRLNPEFVPEILGSALHAHNIEYLQLGNELGGRPKQPECYEEGRVVYELLGRTEPFQHGLQVLREVASEKLAGIICVEIDPIECHRMLLISRLLRQEFQISHIIPGSTIEPHKQSEVRLVREIFGPGADPSSNPELLDEAYRRQGQRFAYVTATPPRLDTPGG
jgi:uncharacterized protein (DUF488 family)